MKRSNKKTYAESGNVLDPLRKFGVERRSRPQSRSRSQSRPRSQSRSKSKTKMNLNNIPSPNKIRRVESGNYDKANKLGATALPSYKLYIPTRKEEENSNLPLSLFN